MASRNVNVKHSVRTILILATMCILAVTPRAVMADVNVQSEMRVLQSYYSEREHELLIAQLVMQEYGVYQGEVDGKWGALTTKAFERVLHTYISIGGSGPDWGINMSEDVPRLVNWMAAAIFANKNGTDFPD